MASFDETAASAARVGAELRAARERLGWSLPELAAHLRIRLPYLEALEEGRIGDLPGVAYAVGFLRTYATVLGLDPDEISRRFRAEAAEANRKTELNFPAPVPDRGVPAGAVVLVGALLAVGAYIGWYRASEHAGPVAEMVQPVPERLAVLAEKPTPPPPAPVAAPPAAETPASQLASSEPPPPPLPDVSPSSAAAAVVVPPLTPPPPAASPAPSTPVAAAMPAPDAISPAAPPSPHLAVQATADAWIQVREKGGQVLLNRVLRGGETWVVPDRPALLMTTGNAGGTELVVDGVATAPLGREGAVRRDLPLDVDAIKADRVAPVPRHP
ncbi:MAG TPA: helix-turn-helix domain-containing protein [Acetobacteraceae bacterium]|nr:helix-turn-helix domain-containing protein [Acetobacteraceae bacterium]